MGSDRCHTVTHNVPIQAQHPPSWPRKVTRTTKETLLPRRTARLAALGGPGIILDDQICIHVVKMGVVWTVEVTGYPHGRWERHPTVTSAKVTPPRVCKHGRGGG